MTEPIIDPVTGKPKAPDGNNTPPGDFVQISKEQWGGINARLDTFEKMGYGSQQPAAAPSAPTGPSFNDRVREIDAGIDALSSKIDEAVSNGKPVSALLNERDKLTSSRLRMQIKHEDIDPAMAQGIETIDQLSDTVTRGQMPHLSIVQADYNAALNSLTPETRMNPKMRKAAYDIAVGQNVDKIMAAEQERILREAAEPPPDPGSSSRASGAETDTIPKPEEVLSRDTLKALKLKGQTAETYYKSMGYEGWDDFYVKRGKEYFG